jgi:hypothetical protein
MNACCSRKQKAIIVSDLLKSMQIKYSSFCSCIETYHTQTKKYLNYFGNPTHQQTKICPTADFEIKTIWGHSLSKYTISMVLSLFKGPTFGECNLNFFGNLRQSSTFYKNLQHIADYQGTMQKFTTI